MSEIMAVADSRRCMQGEAERKYERNKARLSNAVASRPSGEACCRFTLSDRSAAAYILLQIATDKGEPAIAGQERVAGCKGEVPAPGPGV